MAEKQVKKTSAEETVEDVKVEDTAVNEGTDVAIDQVENVSDDNAEEARPKPVPKGSRRGSKALMMELEKTKELAKDNEDKYKRLLAEFENARQRNEK